MGGPQTTIAATGADGYVKVAAYNGANWVIKGSAIIAEQSFEYLGKSVALSSDGTVLAVGASNYGKNGERGGRVLVFQWSPASSNYARMGNLDALISTTDGQRLGESVALADNGLTLVAGGPENANSGLALVARWNAATNAWQLVGEIRGEDQTGHEVAISRDGSVVAVLAPAAVALGSPSTARARVYYLDAAGALQSIGQDINVLETAVNWSLAMSGSVKGTTSSFSLFIGNDGSDGNGLLNRGSVAQFAVSRAG
jgi:hypothetical protein